jgi:hypothetical protein
MEERSVPVDGVAGGDGRIVLYAERDGKRHGPQMKHRRRGA